ncbi:hypothetical protein NL676_038535 [Syzygium grande]|nr:hypothetical protein NL676_038535 [Syzygium grande]
METLEEEEEYSWREVKLPSLVPVVGEAEIPELERETGGEEAGQGGAGRRGSRAEQQARVRLGSHPPLPPRRHPPPRPRRLQCKQ